MCSFGLSKKIPKLYKNTKTKKVYSFSEVFIIMKTIMQKINKKFKRKSLSSNSRDPCSKTQIEQN